MAQISHREQLIEGAIECLQEKGYARTTARDIVAASGANLASIGYHFGSKQALLDEALVRVCMQRNARIGETTIALEDADPLDRLRETFVAVLELFEEHRPLLVAFIEAMAQVERSDELRARMVRLYQYTRQAAGQITLDILGPAGEKMKTDPEVFASLLIAIFDGLVMQWLLDPDHTPPGDAMVDSIVEVLSLASNSRKDGAPAVGRRVPKRRR